jgi:hypothetical protein
MQYKTLRAIETRLNRGAIEEIAGGQYLKKSTIK